MTAIINGVKLEIGPDADLADANLAGANLRRANLRAANLRRANLRGADLRGANLRGAALRGANLAGANLWGANLAGANLRGADLWGANLRGANLWAANLRRADLRGADLRGANLAGTCLDPTAVIPEQDLSGLGEIHDGWVYARRTRTSQHCGSQEYMPGQSYEAPVFSVDATSSCHPGIYLASAEYLAREYPNVETVRVRARVGDVLQVADKFRARRIEVMP